MTWREQAECVNHPDLFFLERGDSSEPARQICNQCPVTDECRDYAIETRMQFGIWGGMTIKQLRDYRKQQPKPFKHGYAAYRDRGCRCETCLEGRARESRMAAERKRIREQKRLNGVKRRRRGQPPVHGTDSGYRNHGCRCDDCKEAARQARSERKEKKSA
jgi:hypothetical protein